MVQHYQLTENVEMYLKAIYLLTMRSGEPAKTGEISELLGISPPSVTEMMDKLADEGLLVHEKYHGASLTEKGEEVARAILTRHCLIERFLLEIVGLEVEEIHEQACRMEHVLSEATERAIRKLVDIPEECPSCYDLEKNCCSRLLPLRRRD